MSIQIKDRSQTLVRGGGADAKKGALKIFDPCKGGPEKNYHRFSIKKWVYMLFYGVDQ